MTGSTVDDVIGTSGRFVTSGSVIGAPPVGIGTGRASGDELLSVTGVELNYKNNMKLGLIRLE